MFTGQFSELMVQMTRPRSFHAIDPWHVAYGEYFPNWGAYSANGALKTSARMEAAQARLARFPNTHVAAQRALDWIVTLAEN